MLKKLDALLIESFVPPFVVTFFIALFVLVMQTLWLYIDDIAGKGVGFFLLVELVSYMSMSMIPMALPVAVLISSVMVLGNLAERYELSSIKSAGISLWRVMRPMMLVAGVVAVFSFFCSNYIIPVANLKFKSRLYDIRRQKPTLSLEESVFNDDFHGFSIRIGNKLPDSRTIEDVLLYDNAEGSQGRLSMVAADSGDMFGSEDGKFFVMHLYKGSQIAEPKPVNKDGKRNHPMIRTSFSEWIKVFDLDEFELDRTDENLFKSHHTMLSNRQLLVAIDSIDKEISEKIERSADRTNDHFYFEDKAWEERRRQKRKEEAGAQRKKMEAAKDSLNAGTSAIPAPSATADSLKKNASPFRATPSPDDTTIRPGINPRLFEPVKPAQPGVQRKLATDAPVVTRNPKAPQTPPKPNPEVLPLEQTITKELSEYRSIAETFPKEKWGELFDKAKTVFRTLRDQGSTTLESLKKTRESRVKHIFEYHSKFSMAIACIIFLFVGAPMGAIVRKGGFGWPLLISIVFFMLFVVITIFSKNIAERFVIHAVFASWMNCLIVFPMGLALTYWAMRDTNLTQLADFFNPKLWVSNLKRGKNG